MMDLDDPIEIAPGVTKPLGDCTREDMDAAEANSLAKAAHYRESAERLAAGKAPGCDWRNSAGSYCERDGKFVSTDPALDAEGQHCFCAQHVLA